MKKGFIIVGFPGIGKSTLAKEYDRVIDLESSWFPKENNWAITYCTIANELCNQGYIVCISSHKEVRTALFCLYDLYKNIPILIYPEETLYEDWILKLKKRYKTTNLEKDLRALDYMKKNYKNAVKEMQEDSRIFLVFDKIVIKNMNYNLADLVLL